MARSNADLLWLTGTLLFIAVVTIWQARRWSHICLVSPCARHRIALGLQDLLTASIQQRAPIQLLADSPEVKELLGKVDTLEARQAVLVAAAKRHAADQMQQLPDSVCRLALPNRLEQARSKHKLAVIMPYRDRADHLANIVPRLHEYLKVRRLCWAEQLHSGSVSPPSMSVQSMDHFPKHTAHYFHMAPELHPAAAFAGHWPPQWLPNPAVPALGCSLTLLSNTLWLRLNT